MIVWALPRLARRFGINPVSALWLGAANPLVLFHLVVGVHNESLAIGLMLVGHRAGRCGACPAAGRAGRIRRGSRASCSGTASAPRSSRWARSVKIPAALALGFLGVMIARRWGGRWKHLFVTAGALLR